MNESEFEQRLRAWEIVPSGNDDLTLGDRLKQAVPLKQQLDAARGWQEEFRPKIQRGWAAGRLLFQFIGLAGYAGYFMSMHALMRIVSGALLGGTWYAIYRMKEVKASLPGTNSASSSDIHK